MGTQLSWGASFVRARRVVGAENGAAFGQLLGQLTGGTFTPKRRAAMPETQPEPTKPAPAPRKRTKKSARSSLYGKRIARRQYRLFEQPIEGFVTDAYDTDKDR
jgi:hypothetical protein